MKTGKNYWNHKVRVLLLLQVLVGCMGNTRGDANTDAPFWRQANAEYNVVSLVYHRFGDARYPSTNTSETAFEQHLKYLSDEGFKSYTVSELLNDTSDLGTNKKKVLITVDDGFASFIENGMPLLEKYKMKATLYVNTESVEWSDYLSWQQLKELKAKGIEIGSHSHEHKYFVNVPEDKRVDVFEEDLLKAESLFEEHLGFIPKTYVYPYGEFSSGMVEVLRKHDYQIAFAQNSGVMSNRSHPLAVPRFPVAGNHVEMEQFRSKVNMRSLNVRKEDYLPIIVDAGEALSYTVRLIGDEVSGPFNCFVAGQSSPDVISQQGDSLSFRLKVPSNRRRTLVTLTTRDENGAWHWFSRLLINPANEE